VTYFTFDGATTRGGETPRSWNTPSPGSTSRAPAMKWRMVSRINSEGPYHFYFKQLIRKLVGAGGRGNLFKTDPDMPDDAITPEYVTQKLVIAGTVESVVQQLLDFREQVGAFGTLLYACHDWLNPTLGQRSMQLMAEQVMPRLNAAIAAQAIQAGGA